MAQGIHHLNQVAGTIIVGIGGVTHVVGNRRQLPILVGVGYTAQTLGELLQGLTRLIVLIGGNQTCIIRGGNHLVLFIVGVGSGLTTCTGDAKHVSFAVVGHGGA